GHAVWIWTHRRVGAYDPDEAGYIANALRFQRVIDPTAPWVFVREVVTTGTGPVVPLLSVPLLLLGPRDPRTVMMIQPVLLVVLAVGTAAVTRRLSGPRAAIAAGLVAATIPTVTLATQSYWLGLGAATCCVLAAWALLASDRLRNDWTLVFGSLVGLMVMTRTMALGFAPGLFLAAAVLAGRDRRSWWGLVKAGAAAAIVAAPWWAINWTGLTKYLLSYGYGPRAGKFGSGGVLERVGFRWQRLTEGIGVGRWLVWLVVIGLLTSLVRTVLLRRNGGEWPPHLREGLALTAAVLCGVAALVSTTNNGVWFELPLLVLALALVTAGLARAWWPVQGALGAAAIVLAAATIGQAWWWIGPGPGRLTGSAHYENGFAQYDPRFGPTRRDAAAAAARDWSAANTAVARAIAEVPTGVYGTYVVMSGNMQLLNSNSVGMAAELDGRPAVISIPDTYAPERVLREDLRPFPTGAGGDGIEKVVVIARHRQTLFTPDERVDRFDRLATELGWREWRTVRMPDGGEVAILRHPDAARPTG
ncbi:MAG: hypothetical protein ACOYOP_15070, partial [Microthrixaceae bacterium]